MKLTPAYIAAQVLTCAFDYDGTLTICTLTLKNGFKSVGYSSCMDAANYDRAVGEQAAHKQALDKLWEHESYFFYKLGLTQAKGVIDERLGVAVNVRDSGDKWYQPHASVTVHMQPEAPVVNVTNLNTGRLFLDTPKFSRDIVRIIMKNKAALGLPSMAKGGPVPGPILTGSQPSFPLPPASAKARAAVRLRDAGFSYSEIGRALSVSKQHAHRLVKSA